MITARSKRVSYRVFFLAELSFPYFVCVFFAHGSSAGEAAILRFPFLRQIYLIQPCFISREIWFEVERGFSIAAIFHSAFRRENQSDITRYIFFFPIKFSFLPIPLSPRRYIGLTPFAFEIPGLGGKERAKEKSGLAASAETSNGNDIVYSWEKNMTGREAVACKTEKRKRREISVLRAVTRDKFSSTAP